MKFLVLLPCLVVAVCGVTPELLEKFKAQMIELGTACQGEVGASNDDIAPMMAHQPPTTPKGKCFIACMNKKYGFQDAAGKISKEGTYAWLDSIKSTDEELYGKMKQVADNCLAEVSDAADECETGANVFVCIKKEEKVAGVPQINFN